MTSPLPSAQALPGEVLPFAEWGPVDAPPVLAVHGITASSRAWLDVADALPDRRVIAPDLRGRGAARDLPGPWGLRRHAADLRATLRAAGVERAVVVGHSMGAFVSVLLAARYPDTVDALVLADGGMPLPPAPAGSDGLALLGPAADRLRMRFDSAETHRDLWRQHPAFREAWSPHVDAYVAYDLAADGEAWRSAVSLDAAAHDAQELRGPEWYLAALRQVSCPVVFLRAPRGLLDEPAGLYPETVLGAVSGLVPQAHAADVPNVNHYTIVMSPAGAAAVADVVHRIPSTGLHPR